MTRPSASRKIERKVQKIKANINGSTTCQHHRFYGYPNRPTQRYDIYACGLPIGHEGDHGQGGWSGPWSNEGPNPDIIDLSNVSVYLVGGAVREIVRGFPDNIKDWDFAIEAESFDQMRQWIELNDFEIFVETPQYYTIRARAPKGYEFAGIDMSGKTFDFALCRSEGSYSDGRHPDEVKPGTLLEDLSRRDFTMNAIAMDFAGNYIDPFDGRQDIEQRLINCVGGTERLEEDALRMVRAIRFSVQLNFFITTDISRFLEVQKNLDLIDNISVERIRLELHKMFTISSPNAMRFLTAYDDLLDKLFERGGLWLEPTTKGR